MGGGGKKQTVPSLHVQLTFNGVREKRERGEETEFRAGVASSHGIRAAAGSVWRVEKSTGRHRGAADRGWDV